RPRRPCIRHDPAPGEGCEQTGGPHACQIDAGEIRRGVAAIRGWQEGPASRYQDTTAVLGSGRTSDDTYLVTGRLDGRFPGRTVELWFRYTVEADLISRLEIAP